MRLLLAAALLALLTLPAAHAASLAAPAASSRPIVEVRDCYEYPNGKEVYVLGIGLGCIGPAASRDASAPPIVERRKCDGDGQDGVEYFVLGHSLGCIQP